MIDIIQTVTCDGCKQVHPIPSGQIILPKDWAVVSLAGVQGSHAHMGHACSSKCAVAVVVKLLLASVELHGLQANGEE